MCTTTKPAKKEVTFRLIIPFLTKSAVFHLIMIRYEVKQQSTTLNTPKDIDNLQNNHITKKRISNGNVM